MIKNIVNAYNYLKPTYGGGLSNHLPMAMVALEGLGADEKRILDYGKWYVKKKEIETLITKNEIKIDRLDKFIGHRKYYFELKEFFLKAIEKNGLEKTLKTYSDFLIEGSAGEAFHGLIRLAYGIDSKNELEIASGLAYLADGFIDFNIDVNSFSTHDPLDQMQRLKSVFEENEVSLDKGLITKKMKVVASDERFYESLRRLPEIKCNKESLNELALKLFGGSHDFTLLHGFTSTHALILLEPYLDDVKKAYEHHWLHLQIAYLSAACPKIEPIHQRDQVMAWEDVLENAIDSNDAHTHKVIYSLYKCFKIFEDQSWSKLYQYVAEKRIKLESQ